ncbi:MAG: HAD-IIIA family hydrolase [Puniceicoccales bacterium]|jgi:D-glycero-D-manno-heptose 1,7-bisphosphate phosphatase|nr:HAD-IIIA family hydrolase [Puniceicoccales bacterium]
MATVKSKIAIFLDRDGTIIVDKNYPSDPEGVELLSGAREAITLLKNFGCLLFLFSNQSGIGRGLLTFDDANACNRRMVTLLGCGDGVFDEICMATEAPSADPIYRKPSPRFILEMIEKYGLSKKNCHMVGDKESDVFAGINAGINSALILENLEGNGNFSANFDWQVFPSILVFSNWLISKNS